MAGETHYIYNISGGEDSSIHDGDTDNTVTYDPGLGTGTITVDVNPGDYVEWIHSYYQYDDPAVPSQYSLFDLTPYYVYTANNVWKYAGNSETNNPADCGYQNYYNTSYCIATDSEDNEITEGSTGTEIKLTVRQDAGDLIRAPLLNSNSIYYHYTGSVALPFADPDNYGTIQYLTGTVTVQPKYGDVLTDTISYTLRYQYPGVWVDENNYPDLTISPKPPQVKSHVQLKWTDPPNLTDWDPYPCTWEGTVIVRKEDSPPLHRWDGTKVVKSSTRDKYKTEPYKDEDIVSGKTYYYAFMPYYTRYEDPDYPIRYYTFTKVIKVEIGDKSLSSTIDSIVVDGTDATINYTLSQPDGGSFTSIKMYGKIGKNPKCDNTDDVVEDVDSSVTSLTLTGLESGSTYYFCLVTMDTNNKKLSSNVMSCYPFDPVPANIKPYISTMNDIAAYKFAWANIPEWYYARLTCHYQHPATKYSYSTVVYSSTVMDTFSNNFSYSGLRVSDVRTYNILTLNVTKNNGTNYTGRIDFPAGSTASIHNLYNPKNANASWMSVGVSSVESGAINFYNYGNTGDGDTTNDYVSYSGTLEQVFAWFADRFRNIDIFVDGIQFAKSHYDDT